MDNPNKIIIENQLRKHHKPSLIGKIRAWFISRKCNHIGQDIIIDSGDKVEAMSGENFVEQYGYGKINVFNSFLADIEAVHAVFGPPQAEFFGELGNRPPCFCSIWNKG